MAFLTLEDPNAKIKGSRDPLGVQPMWSAFGWHLVTNLTTVTDTVRGFTTLMLGRYFAGSLIDDGRIPREEALNGFLRMEQIAALREALEEIAPVPPITGPLESAFPVVDTWLRGDLTKDDIQKPDVESWLRHFDTLWAEFSRRYRVDSAPAIDRGKREGTGDAPQTHPHRGQPRAVRW